MRIETVNGRHLLCGGILKPSAVQVNQRWAAASGNDHVVTVEAADGELVTYSWIEHGAKRIHSKSNFAFQCRYCLVLDKPEIPEELL